MRQRQPTVASRATIISGPVSLQQVEAFVRVVEAGSFTGAGRLLGVPKSSVSRAVSRLEKALGAVLIRRTTRTLAVTDAGQRYLASAREALTLLANAGETLRDSEAEPSGSVRITAPHDPSGGHVVEAIATFCARHPSIEVEVVFTPRRLDLVKDHIDLAVRAGKVDDASLAGRRIGAAPTILVAAPQYVAARGAPRSLAQLADHECVLFRAARNRQRWTLSRAGRRQHVDVRGRVSVNELAYVSVLAKRGAGIARAPRVLVQEALDEGSLVQVLPACEWVGDALYVVHPAGRKLPRRVQLLRDHLYEHLRTKMSGLSR